MNEEYHRDHLDSTCNSIHDQLRCMIDESMSCYDACSPGAYSPFTMEIYQHWLFARREADGFMHRDDVVKLVKAYVASCDCKPLVLVGPPGVGKTSIVAKIAPQVGIVRSSRLHV